MTTTHHDRSRQSPYRIGPLLGILVIGFIGFSARRSVPAQVPAAGSDQAIERFTELLLRRPRPGIALDRVYGHHLQNRTLAVFLQSLDVAETSEGAGQRQMVLGLIQLRRGLYTKATEALVKADRWLVKDPMASFQLGKALLATGKTREAAEAMQRSLDRGPRRSDAAEIYLELGRLYSQSGDQDKAMQTWQQLQRQFPGDKTIAERIARCLVDEQFYEAALEQYAQLAREAENAEQKTRYQIQVAELQRILDRPAQANEQLRSLLMRLRPGSWLYRDVRDRLEAGLLNDGSYAALAEFYSAGVKRSPDDVTLRIRLGQIQSLAGRPDLAEATLQAAVTRAPGDIAARIALIDVLDRADRLSDISPQFETLVRLDPNHPDHFVRWGLLLLRDVDRESDARRDAAAEVWDRLLRSRPDDPALHVRVAKLFANIDRTDKAVALYRRAIELDPDSPQYREYLGEQLHSLKRTDEAIQVWRSIATGPHRNRESLVRLAEIFAAFEFNFQSLQAWREASSFDLTFHQRLRYARALLAAKAYRQATAQLETAEVIAETRDERRQVLRDKIVVYTEAGMLRETIAKIARQKPSVKNRLLLALLYLADNQLPHAALTIEDAVEQAPDEIETLVVAADIAQRQQRRSDAIKLYERLSELDGRFRTNYLRRIVTLQHELGDLEQAVRTAGDLIRAAPGTPDSHQMFAEMAFALGRDEEAVAALRNAVDLAPRENHVRLMLANHYAERFQTDPAIELYWEAIEVERDWDLRRELLQALVPLYERRGQSDQLLRRLERFALTTKDRAQTQRLVASFWQSIGNFKRASFLLRQLVDQQGDDGDLIRQTVTCLVELSDFKAAIDYQRQLLDLAGTPADYDLLAELQVNSGRSDPFDLFARELADTNDPQRAMTIIDRAADQSHPNAIELCRIVTGREPAWWGIKCVQSQMLFKIARDADDARLSEAIRLAGQIDALDARIDTPPPCRASQVSGTGLSGNYTIRFSPQIGRSGSAKLNTYTVPKRNFTSFLDNLLGEVDSAKAAGASAAGASLRPVPQDYLIPEDFHQARWISRAIGILGRCKQNSRDGKRQTVHEVIEELFPMPPPDQINDPDRLEELLAFYGLEKSLTGASAGPPESLFWRMADVAPQAEHPQWRAMLEARTKRMRVEGDGASRGPRPLDEHQLSILAKVVSARQNMLLAGVIPAEQIGRELELHRSMIREFRRAGKDMPTPRRDTQQSQPNRLMVDIADIQVALWENDLSRADKLVAGLTDIARRDPHPDLLGGLQGNQVITWLFAPSSPSELDFLRRHRTALLDAWLAHCARRITLKQKTLTGDEFVRQYGADDPQRVMTVVNAMNLRSQQNRLQSTLSKYLIDDYLIQGLDHLALRDGSRHRNVASASPSDDWLADLERDLPGATEQELKLRKLIVAYAAWWNHRPADCYRKLLALCETYPGDVDLQIELARFEIETAKADQGFARLSNLKATDHLSAQKLELAKLHLAIRIGALQPVRDAADRFLKMQLDSSTRSAFEKFSAERRLARQAGPSVATPRRIVSRAMPVLRRDDVFQLRIAKSLLVDGNRVTASEVAFSIIQNHLADEKNIRSAVTHQSMDILIRAGRTDQLISMFERQIGLEGTPGKPAREGLIDALTDLYQRAGQAEKATTLWERAIDEEGLTPESILARADALRADRKSHQAAITYLFAFERDPGLWKAHWSAFAQSGEASKNPSAIYSRLSTFDISPHPLFSLCNVIGIRSGDSFSENQRAFARHVIQTHPDIPKKLSLLKQFVPESERSHFPRLVELLKQDRRSPQAGRRVD